MSEFVTPVSSEGGENSELFVTPVSSEGGENSELFLTPETSQGGLTPQVNARPQLNESLMEQERAVGFVPPQGLFTNKYRTTLVSRIEGELPFFANAKPASMLERGWVRPMMVLIGDKGLLTIRDGPEILVKIMGWRLDPETNRYVYIIKNLADPRAPLFQLRGDERHEEWEFYTPTEAVPFVPRGGSKKTRRKKAKKRGKSRRKA